MPNIRPLKLDANGNIVQFGANDTVDATVSSKDVFAATNGSGSPIAKCAPVRVLAAGTVTAACADTSTNVAVIGLMTDDTAAAAAGTVQTDGVMTAETAKWDAVTGQTGGLTAGSLYFLDPVTPGKLTTTVPTASGKWIQRVGRALSSTDLEISIAQTPLGLA